MGPHAPSSRTSAAAVDSYRLEGVPRPPGSRLVAVEGQNRHWRPYVHPACPGPGLYLERPAAGGRAAEITLAPDRRDATRLVTATVLVLRHVRVTDSGGHPELRPLIETELVLGPVRRRIYLTLTDRSGMLFRMILGRKAVEGDFWVDPAAKYLLRAWHRRRVELNRERR